MRNLAALSFRTRRRGLVEPPARPLLAALPLALLVLAMGFVAGVGRPWLLAVAGSAVVVGLLQAARAAVQLGRQCR